MAAKPELEVYFDASCAFCRRFRARVEPWDTHQRLRFFDYHVAPQIAASIPYSPEELEREIHVREGGRVWAAGFAAWVRILRVLPGLAWLGWLLGMPPCRWLGPTLYRWVARHRFLVGGVPPSCTAETCAPPARRAH